MQQTQSQQEEKKAETLYLLFVTIERRCQYGNLR